MDETKKKLYVERDGFWTEASMLFIALAVVFRLIGSIGRWEDARYLLTQVALPVFSGLLFLVCLLFAGKKAFWATVIPVVLGVAFFIFRSMSVENEWIMVGCIVLYVVIAVLYAMTFSIPLLKWALAGILLLAFLVHVIFLDAPVLMDLEHPVSFVDGMQEMSILGVILSMLCVSIAMKYPSGKTAPEQPIKPAALETPAPAPQTWGSQEPLHPYQPPEQPQEPREEPAVQEPEEPEPVAEEPEELEPLQEELPEAPEESLPPVSPVLVQELDCVAEPAPAFPVDEPIAEEETEKKADGDEAENA